MSEFDLNCNKCGDSLSDWFCCQECEMKEAERNGRYLMALELLEWIKETVIKDAQSDITFYGDIVDAEELTCKLREMAGINPRGEG